MVVLSSHTVALLVYCGLASKAVLVTKITTAAVAKPSLW